jgi:hypothetical protein
MLSMSVRDIFASGRMTSLASLDWLFPPDSVLLSKWCLSSSFLARGHAPKIVWPDCSAAVAGHRCFFRRRQFDLAALDSPRLLRIQAVAAEFARPHDNFFEVLGKSSKTSLY